MKYVLDTHCHTVSSGHAYSTITENAAYAAEIGFELIAMTDHAPEMPGSSYRFHFDNLKILPKKINGVEILKGAEVNIMNDDGMIDLPDALLERLDIVIASLHIPCMKPMSREKNTAAMINAMSNPNVDILGHPGDMRYPFDVAGVVSAAKKTHTLIEINNTSLNPENPRFSGVESICGILTECKKQEHFISLGSDAHYHTYIGDFNEAEKLIQKVDFPERLIINTSVEKLKKWLNNN